MMKRTFLLITIMMMVSLSAIFAGALTAEDAEEVLWVREEEKLARDVYLTLYEQWGLTTFRNIAESEQKHMDAVKEELIIPYGLEDPVTKDTVGVFTDPELQAIYNQLIEKGSASIEDAVEIGMMIEEMNTILSGTNGNNGDGENQNGNQYNGNQGSYGQGNGSQGTGNGNQGSNGQGNGNQNNQGSNGGKGKK